MARSSPPTPGTGETGPQEVTATTDSNGGPTVTLRDLVAISIDEDGDGISDGDITATAGHAFWIAEDTIGTNGQWTTATNLEAGDWLRTSDGRWVETDVVSLGLASTAAYNITIETWHTYFVDAGADVFTHNCKPINLSAWKKMSIDMDHIMDRHTVGGATFKQSGKEDAFPDAMTENQIRATVGAAYRNIDKRIGMQGDRIQVQGNANGMRIEMWINTKTKEIETAYPVGW